MLAAQNVLSPPSYIFSYFSMSVVSFFQYLRKKFRECLASFKTFAPMASSPGIILLLYSVKSQKKLTLQRKRKSSAVTTGFPNTSVSSAMLESLAKLSNSLGFLKSIFCKDTFN